MIHTDGKPTIANTRLAPNPALAALQRAVANGRPIDWNKIVPARPDWSTCDIDTAAGYDVDSLPGGYDNPAAPYDWEGMDLV